MKASEEELTSAETSAYVSKTLDPHVSAQHLPIYGTAQRRPQAECVMLRGASEAERACEVCAREGEKARPFPWNPPLCRSLT